MNLSKLSQIILALILFALIPRLDLFSQTPVPFYSITAGNGNGIRFWESDNWKMHMGIGAEYSFGPVTDYSIKLNMDATAGRGAIPA
jgi:hypothetical protein